MSKKKKKIGVKEMYDSRFIDEAEMLTFILLSLVGHSIKGAVKTDEDGRCTLVVTFKKDI